MATKKPVQPEYDFDNYDEAAGIAQAVEAAKVKYIIVEGRKYVARFPNGEVIEVPLDLSLEDIENLSTEANNPVDQVKELLRTIGGDAAVKQLLAQGMASTVVFAEQYFKVMEKITKAALGE